MSDMTLKDWTAAAAGLSLRHQIFLDGQFVPSASGKTFDSINPATGAVLAHVAEGDEEDIRRAVVSGRKAFESGVWSRMAPMDRKAVLLKLADLIRSNLTELALLDSMVSHGWRCGKAQLGDPKLFKVSDPVKERAYMEGLVG